MTIRYHELAPTGAERLAIAQAVRAILGALKHELSLSDICENINRARSDDPINLNALKLFLYRNNVTRVNATRTGGVLPALYDFIKLHYDRFPPAAKQATVQNWGLLEPRGTAIDLGARTPVDIEQNLATLIGNWTNVDPLDVRFVGERLEGNFVLFRKSSSFDHIVIQSRLNITYDKSLNVIRGKHEFKDMREGVWTSAGLFVPVGDNTYGILSVEKDAALEIIVLAHPIPKKWPPLLHGASITIGLQRAPISANIVLDRDTEWWSEHSTRLNTHAETRIAVKEKLDNILPFLTSNIIQT